MDTTPGGRTRMMSSCMAYSTGIFSVVYSQSVYVQRISMLAIIVCYGGASVINA